MEPTPKLAEALLAAQLEMPAVKPDATNPHFRSKFVSLGHLIAKARPVLNKHGVAVAQFPSQDERGQPTLTTILLHKSGERLEYEAPLFLPKNDPQGQGSALTYLRRYALASALAISDQEDDDGNAASKAKATNGDRPKQKRSAVVAALGEAEATGAQIRGWLSQVGTDAPTPERGVEALTAAVDSLTDEQADTFLTLVNGAVDSK